MEGEHPDLVLLRQALGRDRRALRRLGDRIDPLIDARIRRRLPNGRSVDIHDLEDIGQWVWVRLFEREGHRLKGFDPARGSLESFVSKVADNLIIDRLRVQGEAQMDVAVLHDDEIEDPAPNPEERTSVREEARLLRAHLDSILPLKGRLVLRLLYDDHRPEDETAEIMGVSKQVVANWKHKIKTLARAFRENSE